MHVMKREQPLPPQPPRREVPEDIIANVILPKLPTKSLLRFKSVNKSWKHWITSSEFARLHLLNQSSLKSIHTDDDHVILTRRETLFSMPMQGSIAAASNVDDPVEMEYPFKSPHHTVKVLGSCNGLVLLKIKEIPLHHVLEFLPETGIWNPLYRGFRPPETCIWNPCTMEYIILPRVPKQSREYFHELGCGIGYDSSTDEYKESGYSVTMKSGFSRMEPFIG
ncbi:hypothetical protein Syun_008469 [Stephania yunnanensis]|uniref:F-box domain-containing protein n=1 Tax=Stephania yunnanensis TaxID=152371 RepID=A0AAP0PQ11_9MAGN